MELWRSRVFRIALSGALALAGAIVLVFTVMVVLIGRDLEREAVAGSAAKAAELLAELEAEGPEGLLRSVKIASDPGFPSNNVVLLARRDGSVIAGNLPAWPAGVPLAPTPGVRFARVRRSERPGVVYAVVVEPAAGQLLLVGRDPPELTRRTDSVQLAVVFASVLSVLFAMAVAWLLARHVARRLQGIAALERSIVESGLLPRLGAVVAGDEFDRHAEAIDGLFVHLQTLMDSMRHVGENVAHDIRKPLSALRNRLERLHEDSAPGAQREALSACLADADQLLATFAALLRIARIEGGALERPNRPVALHRVVADAIDLYAPVGEERNVALRATLESCSLLGDADLLFQAIANLLDNALRFAPVGSVVQVVLSNGPRPRLQVIDCGPGIAPSERERVFERFYRVDRSRPDPGAGLGLTLVRAITDLHGAGISLHDANPGLRVEIVFGVAAAG